MNVQSNIFGYTRLSSMEVSFDLPEGVIYVYNKDYTNVPTITNNGRTLKGRGVIPAVPINRSFEDLINKKDPQLDWILNDIKTKK